MNPAHELLTPDDERHLSRLIEAGVLAEHVLASGRCPVPATRTELNALVEQGRAAWERFWLANLRLVWKLAGAQAARTGLNVEELFQEGCVALAGAIQRYDADRGRFSTYAVTRVRQHLVEVAATRFGALAVPPSRAVRVHRVCGLQSQLDQHLGRRATVAEVAREAERSTTWVAAALAHRAPVSLDAPGVPDVAADADSAAEEWLVQAQVRDLLDQVSPQEADLLRLRYGLHGSPPMEVAAIAEQLQVSVSTVRRAERRALARIRAAAHAEPLSTAS